jgi:hypothetical protein|tara:strand:- start:11 stop:193 length:183 start_codon:yes stop_codon:yes gene_type:complete
MLTRFSGYLAGCRISSLDRGFGFNMNQLLKDKEYSLRDAFLWVVWIDFGAMSLEFSSFRK